MKNKKWKSVVILMLMMGVWFLLNAYVVFHDVNIPFYYGWIPYVFMIAWILLLIMNRKNNTFLIYSGIISFFGVLCIVLYQLVYNLHPDTEMAITNILILFWQALFAGLPHYGGMDFFDWSGGLMIGFWVCCLLTILSIIFIRKNNTQGL